MHRDQRVRCFSIHLYCILALAFLAIETLSFTLGQPELPGGGFVLSIHVKWKEDMISFVSDLGRFCKHHLCGDDPV